MKKPSPPLVPPTLPRTMKGRPVYKGVPVPFFVAYYLGTKQVDERTPGAIPSFPTTDMNRAIQCRRHNRCWICGKTMGAHKTFVFGPASAITRVSAEPPSHRDCAIYAAKVCPFMVGRIETLSRDESTLREGEQIDRSVSTRNPGLTVLWTAKSYRLIPVDPSRGQFNYEPGDPSSIGFYHRGREATHEEVARLIAAAIEHNKLDKLIRAGELAHRVQLLYRYMST